MKNITALIDTNVIMTFITKREDPYKDACVEIMKLCAENMFDGYLAFYSLSTIWYVIRKQKNEEEARAWLSAVCDMLKIAEASQEQVRAAINNLHFQQYCNYNQSAGCLAIGFQ